MIDEALWRELESQHLDDTPGLARRRVREDSNRDLFVGVRAPSGERVLVLSVDPSATQGLADLPETKALRTSVEESPDQGRIDVRVALVTPEMARVFTPFVEDVLDAVAPAPSDAEAVRLLVSRFGYWKNLLSAVGPEGLSRSQQQGLYGELWCLRHVVFPELGPRAVTAWTGPDRDDRDFQFGTIGIEIKTTVLDNPPTVEVTSERQLESAPYTDLFLLALALEALPAGTGQTLNELADELLDVLGNDDARFAMRDRLLQYGYVDLHRERYAGTFYTVRRFWRFHVQGGFPRITESALPDGVGGVHYRLSLDACAPWRIEADSLSRRLKEVDDGDNP